LPKLHNLHGLRELHLLMFEMEEANLADIYVFLKTCKCHNLERLFVQVITLPASLIFFCSVATLSFLLHLLLGSYFTSSLLNGCLFNCSSFVGPRRVHLMWRRKRHWRMD
jgi:hypothetical protein